MQSQGVGRLFLLVLGLGLIVSAVGVTLAVMNLFFPATFPALGAFVQVMRPLNIGFLGLSAVAFPLWMSAFHAELLRVYPAYPIGRQRALALIWIPGYNLWGWFHLFTTLGTYLTKTHGEFHRYSRQVALWMPFIYGLGVGLVLWGLVAWREGMLTEGWEVVGAGMVPVGYLLCLGMTTSTMQVVERSMHLPLAAEEPHRH